MAATALSTALVATPASAAGTPPQISVVTGSSGSKTVTLGHPQKAATAKLSPGYVAYDPDGDEAVSVRTSGGQAHVYLIAGNNEPNEYHIATGVTATTHTYIYGTLVKGDAYLVAGNGAAGMVGFPGGGTTSTLGQSPNVGAVTNPVAPVALAFDNSGNLLISEALPAGTPTITGIQAVAKAACSSSCPYKYSKLVAGGLYTITGTGTFTGITTTPAIQTTYQVYGFGLSVDAQGNIIDGGSGFVVFFNEQTTTVTRYGKKLTSHKATVIAGTTLGTATCGSGAVSAPGTGLTSPYLQWPHPFVDASGNVYVNDNQVLSDAGCTWVLPAASGSLDGMTVVAGHMYALTGAATTTAVSNGAVANKTSFPNTVAAVTDTAGNVVIGLSGTTPAVRVIAESSGTFYDQSMTAGHVYTISGGPDATRTTTPGNATGFKLPGATRPATPPDFGLTSLIPAVPGDLLLTDGTAATTASLYVITKGPTHGAPKVTKVTPAKGTAAGGTKVTITGSNFTTVTSVKFGTKTVTSITTKTPTKLTVTTPSGTGTVTVSVTAAGGTGTKAS
ncbi:MAG: IPT/TIG domain-containing protein, partial [Acidimicrobiales bacterium]